LARHGDHLGGVPVLGLAMLFWRAGARLERRRVQRVGTYIATPYRPLPDGLSHSGGTGCGTGDLKDMTYFVLMLPDRSHRVSR